MVLPFLGAFCALHPRLRGALWNRWGVLPASTPSRAVWFHGASAGDIRALLPLVDGTRQAGLPVWVTCWTRTGAQIAQEAARVPFDCSPIVSRVIDRVQPRLIVLECLEMWPALVRHALSRGAPVVIVNGRLSSRSLRWYRRFDWLFRPLFSGLSQVVALDTQSGERFVAAGVDPTRVTIGTSTKHASLPHACVERADRETFVMGSIHRSEAALILPEIPRLLRLRPRLRLVLAPRRVESARWFRRQLQLLGVAVRYRSESDDDCARVVLHDRFGELLQDYANASLAFVGGSLTRRGGHNVVEPAARGLPVLVGPYFDNCRREVELLVDGGACYVVDNAAELVRQADRLLGDAPSRRAAGRAARGISEGLAASSRDVLQQLLAQAAQR